jgi:hypothetical protein
MNTVSTLRLYLLRAGYLLIAAGLGSQIWPQILQHDKPWELMHGVVISMLGALSVLAALGLRYPLAMLPILFFEMAWKSIWLLSVALPAWSSGQMDAGTTETAFECLIVVVFPFLMPWRYVFHHYVSKTSDPWVRRMDVGARRPV